MKQILLLLVLFITALSDDFYFKRVLECQANTTTRCTNWKQTTKLMYYTYMSTFCFSENTHLLTERGPIALKDLKIGDQVLSINPQTSTHQFSPVLAWLHRDEQALVQYQIISTNTPHTFQSSDFHNIGFVDNDGKINFKFAKNLAVGDKLISFSDSNIEVAGTENHKEKKGLYSPFTKNGNFFIFSNQFDAAAYNQDQPMILAHALSQVIDPTSQLSKASNFITFYGLVGGNVQPTDHKRFVHPLVSTFSWIFGSNWAGESQKVKYPSFIQNHEHHEQALPSSSSSYSKYTPSYSSFSSYSPSYSSSSLFSPSFFSTSYSPYSSSYSSYGCNGYSSYSSYSSYNSRSCSSQQERQDRMQALGLSVSIIQEIPLL